MTQDRCREIEGSHLPLTGKEIEEGWHFCQEWDGMLVGPTMEEYGMGLCCRKNPIPLETKTSFWEK